MLCLQHLQHIARRTLERHNRHPEGRARDDSPLNFGNLTTAHVQEILIDALVQGYGDWTVNEILYGKPTDKMAA